MTSYLFRAGGATKYKIDNQPSQGCVALSLALVSSERGRGISGRFRGQIENGELPSRLSVPMLPLGFAFRCTLQPRLQVDRRNHAARAPATNFNGRKVKRHQMRVAG